MKNTRKKKTHKNNITKKCMDTFAKKKIIYWTSDVSKEIKKLENKKNITKEEKQLLTKLKKQIKNQINNLKKQYKLINCNINCKNTLLEPGPPNEIPMTMRKEFHNSKKLIKIFTKRRKDLFKNKTNILKDNFYENISKLEKKNLLKEGAISECYLPLNLKGGSIIFENGSKILTDETYNNKPFFRKVFYVDENNSNTEKQLRLEQAAKTEIYIVNILMKNPHPNIVTFYEINDKYVEMEELDITSKLDKIKVIEIMEKVKDFLQSLGIMYIDWKPDNIGISKDGTYKLYDFDASGVVDLKNPNIWIVKPLDYYSYNTALKNGITNPKEIDNYSFDKGINITNKYRYF
jgi:serine/threonine protein kinase